MVHQNTLQSSIVMNVVQQTIQWVIRITQTIDYSTMPRSFSDRKNKLIKKNWSGVCAFAIKTRSKKEKHDLKKIKHGEREGEGERENWYVQNLMKKVRGSSKSPWSKRSQQNNFIL